MACCDWQTFEDGFLATWRKARPAPGELLIDWKRAKTNWERHHCTGGEAAKMQLGVLANEGLYCWEPPGPRKSDDDSGSDGSGPGWSGDKPSPIKPSPVLA